MTLRDRSEFTPQYLKYNVWEDFCYHVLDTSVGSGNSDCIAASHLDNVTYTRESSCANFKEYTRKLRDFLDRIPQEYVILTDNDDLLIQSGLKECVAALMGNRQAISSGGPVVSFKGRKTPTKWCSIPYLNWRAPTAGGLGAIISSRRDYQHTWYSVCKRGPLVEAFDFVLESKISDPYLVEYGICDFLFSQGWHIATNRPHYARLANQANRAIDAEKSFQSGNYLSRAWFVEAESLDESLAAKFDYDVSQLPSNALRWVHLFSIPSTQPNFWKQVAVYLRLISSCATFLPFPLFAGIARLGVRI